MSFEPRAQLLPGGGHFPCYDLLCNCLHLQDVICPGNCEYYSMDLGGKRLADRGLVSGMIPQIDILLPQKAHKKLAPSHDALS